MNIILIKKNNLRNTPKSLMFQNYLKHNGNYVHYFSHTRTDSIRGCSDCRGDYKFSKIPKTSTLSQPGRWTRARRAQERLLHDSSPAIPHLMERSSVLALALSGLTSSLIINNLNWSQFSFECSGLFSWANFLRQKTRSFVGQRGTLHLQGKWLFTEEIKQFEQPHC